MLQTKAPREQIVDALHFVRVSRHRHDCRCGKFQGVYCTPTEKMWCSAVDRLITEIYG